MEPRAGIWENSISVPGSRSYEGSVIPRSDPRERVTSRTDFLSNSLYRGRVLRAHRLFAFSHCVSLPPFSFPPFVLRIPVSRSPVLFSFTSSLRRNRSYCSRRRRRSRCLFLSPAMPPHSRSEKPDGIFICGTVHNKTPPFPSGSPIADRQFRS